MSNTNSENDPFLKSLATLKTLLSPPKGATNTAQVTRRRSFSPVKSNVATTVTATALQLEIEQERQHRKSLETALEALTESRKTLQTQLDDAKGLHTTREEEIRTLQNQLEELKAAHFQALADEKDKVAKAEQEQKLCQTSLDEANTRVASLELFVKELEEKVQKKEDFVKESLVKHQHERESLRNRVEELHSELKETRAKLEEAKDKVAAMEKESSAAKAAAATTEAKEGQPAAETNEVQKATVEAAVPETSTYDKSPAASQLAPPQSATTAVAGDQKPGETADLGAESPTKKRPPGETTEEPDAKKPAT